MTDLRSGPLVLLGAGGHAKVLQALAAAAGLRVVSVCDPGLAALGESEWRGIPVLGGDEQLCTLDPRSVGLINGLGQFSRGEPRRRIYRLMRDAGYRFPPLVHPTAWVASDVDLGDGVQIMAGAVVQPACQIGENTIINTRASVDHDCTVGRNVHVAPGATLCGGVQVAADVLIGAGAVLLPNVRVGAAATVGAGVTLKRDLAAGSLAVGPNASTRVISSNKKTS